MGDPEETERWMQEQVEAAAIEALQRIFRTTEEPQGPRESPTDLPIVVALGGISTLVPFTTAAGLAILSALAWLVSMMAAVSFPVMWAMIHGDDATHRGQRPESDPVSRLDASRLPDRDRVREMAE